MFENLGYYYVLMAYGWGIAAFAYHFAEAVQRRMVVVLGLAAVAFFLLSPVLFPIMLAARTYKAARTRRARNAWHNIVLHPIAGGLWLAGCKEWGDYVHGEEKPRWWMIEFAEDGPRVVGVNEIPPRPDFARPDGGDPFTPWEQAADHLHYAGDNPSSFAVGAHVYAANAEEAYRKALHLLASQGVFTYGR